ncbi:DUF4153 domain-containing protein [Pedobacter sp. LMG 31464]|uniref:DUF4153 domain-containing protein n=1 Tax=Pedobacter planticolens TaxID=2679964 RepID=A0A923IXN7_9SPHI|nr:DUF4153 domain-containing protein [Pedobacter planticolens]MBB2146532.1 DUF4153 domain-containing protein [Pedobacter planticolens]
MKLPSLQTLWQGTNRVSKRFPFQFLIAIISIGIWWRLIDISYNDQVYTHNLITGLAVCNIALTLLLATDLFCESHHYSNLKKWILRIIVLAISTGLYLLLNPWAYLVDVYRIFLLAFAFHLLVAFAPFIGKSNLNGFWQYNKTLFLRFLTSAFYAAVLYAGLSVALLAIDGLFDVNITYRIYMKLLALVSAGVTTIFFLAGVPDNFEALNEEQSYPKGLKIFTQYVLIPLMTIYLGILLVYEVKIIFQWTLPKGLVSTLILGYAVFGILSLLLIYPIKDKEGNGWMRLFSRFFYLMMIPLIVLLLLAIGKRVFSYGVTESRYILIVLGVWLTAITIYFLISKKQNIKIIPISLCVLALLATYGPQSAFSVSRYSQVSRLKMLIASKNKQEIIERSEVVEYLVDRHGLTSLQSFTNADLETIEAKINANAKSKKSYDYEIKSQKVDTAFSILKIKDSRHEDYNEQVNFINKDKGVISVTGYDAVFSFNEYSGSARMFDGTTFKLDQNSEKEGSKNKFRLTVSIGNENSFDFNLKSLAKEAYNEYKTHKLIKENYRSYEYPSEKMQFIHQTQRYTIKLVVTTMNGNYDSDKKDFDWFDFQGFILVKKN